MFFKNKDKTQTTYNSHGTIIDSTVLVQGDIKGKDGIIIIKGILEGSVKSEGLLKIENTARVNGGIKAKNAFIAGEVAGKVDVNEKIEILKTANIQGDITANVILVEAGAIINGMMTIGVNKKYQSPQEKKETATEGKIETAVKTFEAKRRAEGRKIKTKLLSIDEVDAKEIDNPTPIMPSSEFKDIPSKEEPVKQSGRSIKKIVNWFAGVK